MRRLTIVCLAGALLVSLAPASTAQVPPIDEYVPTFTRADLFLHRNTSPIGNLDAREGRFLKWDATSPTEAQPALYVGNNYDGLLNGNHGTEWFLTMEGTALSDLNNIAFDLYFTGWAQMTIGCQLDLSIQLVIDDVVIVDQDYTGSTGFNNSPVDDTTSRTRFVLTHLWDAVKTYELPYGPDVQHDIYLNVQNFYACNEVVWKYDSAAYPAGMIVNLPTPSGSYFKFNVMDPPPPLAAAAALAAIR
ncbi:MAG: hypothetical protein ACRDH9_07440 [Actinomycetota bacterium]